MTSFADRLGRLAADAARLAAMPDAAGGLDRLAADLAGLVADTAASDDLVQRLLASFARKKLRATHPGHRLFDELGLRVIGPKGFAPEDLAVRRRGLAIELAPRGEMATLMIARAVPPRHDVLLDLDLDLPESATLTTFVQSRSADGGHRDGPGAKADHGTHVIHRLLSAPELAGGDASELALAFGTLTGPVLLRRLAIVAVAR